MLVRWFDHASRASSAGDQPAWATPAPQPQDAPGRNAPDNMSPSSRKVCCSRMSRCLAMDRSTV